MEEGFKVWIIELNGVKTLNIGGIYYRAGTIVQILKYSKRNQCNIPWKNKCAALLWIKKKIIIKLFIEFFFLY